MADLTHKEKDALIQALKDKVAELESATPKLEELSQLGLGVQKTEDGKYALVELKFNTGTNTAVVHKVTELNTHDFAIANYKALQLFTEKIMRKARGDKYVE